MSIVLQYPDMNERKHGKAPTASWVQEYQWISAALEGNHAELHWNLVLCLIRFDQFKASDGTKKQIVWGETVDPTLRGGVGVTMEVSRISIDGLKRTGW